MPGSINSKRNTAKPAREGFVSMCARTEPVRTGIGAVCVEYGRPKWPITMLNHTYIHNNVLFFLLLQPFARTTRYEEAFFPWKTKAKRLVSLARLIIILIDHGYVVPSQLFILEKYKWF